VAAERLGRRPATYSDSGAMLKSEPGLIAVNIVTDTRMHHVLAAEAFAASKHVGVEKPIAITVRAARRMVEQAKRAGKILAVLENFRRDPLVRLAKAAVAAGQIGTPRLLLDVSLSGTRWVQQTTAWRHLKLRGGWLLD